MKRFLAITMALLTVIAGMAFFPACNASKNGTVTMGQWLSLIADSFGMESYVEEKPYFPKVGATDAFFAAFQKAAEWEILPANSNVDSLTPVTWNDALITLANAGNFIEYDASDEDKIDCAIKHLDSGIRKYWGNRPITLSRALPLLDKAQELWANRKFDTKVENAKFAEDVHDFYKNGLDYSEDGNTVIIPASEAEGLSVGDVYTLPATDSSFASINRIKDIRFEGDYAIITNDDSFDEEEAAGYIEELELQDTASVDFSKVAGIYDEAGNPIEFEIEEDDAGNTSAEGAGNYGVSTLAHRGVPGASAINAGFFDSIKGTLKFKCGDWSISISTTANDFAVEISKKLSKSSSRYREKKTEAFVKTTFKNVELTKDIDFSWGILHSATVKLDYKTEIEGGIKITKSTEIGRPGTDGKESRQALSTIIHEYAEALANFSKEVYNTKVEDDIYICRIALFEAGIASVDFIVKGKVEASGEIKVVVELEGAQGIEYKNKNIRFIKSKDIDVNFVADAKIEVTIGPGIAITLLKKISLVEISIDCGLGASVEMKAHLFDAEGHELYSSDAVLSSSDADEISKEDQYTTAEDILAFAEAAGGTWKNYEEGKSVSVMKGTCLIWKLYPIVKIGVHDGILKDILDKFDVKLSVQVLGSKNTILSGHIDFPSVISNVLSAGSVGEGVKAALGIGAECSYDYKPWDDVVDEADASAQPSNDDISVADNIILSSIRVFLDEEQSQDIQIIALPAGYTLDDLEVSIVDESIVSFDVKHGRITAKKKPGSTQIVISTSDGKHTAYCAVTVKDSAPVEFGGLSNGPVY